MDLKSKIIAFFSLPILVASVAIVQVYKVETSDLSRWKGGGFGMYTSINEQYNIIVINDEIISESEVSFKSGYKKARYNFIFYPNEQSVSDFLKNIDTKDEVKKLQIYKPVFDSKTNQLSYKVRYEKVFE